MFNDHPVRRDILYLNGSIITIRHNYPAFTFRLMLNNRREGDFYCLGLLVSHLLKIWAVLANDLRYTLHITSGKGPDWL